MARQAQGVGNTWWFACGISAEQCQDHCYRLVTENKVMSSVADNVTPICAIQPFPTKKCSGDILLCTASSDQLEQLYHGPPTFTPTPSYLASKEASAINFGDFGCWMACLAVAWASYSIRLQQSRHLPRLWCCGGTMGRGRCGRCCWVVAALMIAAEMIIRLWCFGWDDCGFDVLAGMIAALMFPLGWLWLWCSGWDDCGFDDCDFC